MVTTSQNLLRDLLRLALDGDQKSYQEFLLQVGKIIRTIISKKVNSADVEDVVQEVLISIHKSRHTYDCQRSLMPWLMAIINFRVIDYLRKHYADMRHKTSDIEEFVEILTDVTEEPVGGELIDEILAQLDSKQRKIVTMMYLEDCSVKEVSCATNMSESAIKVAAHRAIKKIKQKFSQQ